MFGPIEHGLKNKKQYNGMIGADKYKVFIAEWSFKMWILVFSYFYLIICMAILADDRHGALKHLLDENKKTSSSIGPSFRCVSFFEPSLPVSNKST